jgi:hypothetical protein
MRNHSKFLMMVIVIPVFLLVFQSASAQYAIPRSVFGSGGASSSSSTNKLVGTLGQPLIGTTSGASNRHSAGYWYVQGYLLTSVEEKPVEKLPVEYQLKQNYPNPFNPTTTIEFEIPERVNVKLIVYDILAREISTLVDKELEPGKYKVNFDAKNLPSGVYFYRLEAGKFASVKKMVLVR